MTENDGTTGIDASVVIEKLAYKLGQAEKLIAMLETANGALLEQVGAQPSKPVSGKA